MLVFFLLFSSKKEVESFYPRRLGDVFENAIITYFDIKTPATVDEIHPDLV